MTNLILPKHTFKDTPDEDIVVEHSQVITDEFLDQTKALRDASSAPAGDYHKLASIPTSVVEKWMREGFNIFDENITAAEIVKRLSAEDLGAFITTTKRV
jgi:hypothetical protein